MKEYGDYHGDEDEIESARQEKEDNNPNDEPNFDEWLEIEQGIDNYLEQVDALIEKEDE